MRLMVPQKKCRLCGLAVTTATDASDVIRTPSSLNVDATWRGNGYHVGISAPAFLAALNADFVDPLARAPGRKITQVDNFAIQESRI
jgi:hypothetical protein